MRAMNLKWLALAFACCAIPVTSFAFDSTGLGTTQSTVATPQGAFLLASGMTQLYCAHADDNPAHLPNQTDVPGSNPYYTDEKDYPSTYWQPIYGTTGPYGNCTSPQFESNSTGTPVTCPAGTYPFAHVSVVAIDNCTGNGSPNMFMLEPSNGYIRGYPDGSSTNWFLCFMQAYSLQDTPSSIVINYSIYCAPCPNGNCQDMRPDDVSVNDPNNEDNGCPPANGAGGTAGYPPMTGGTGIIMYNNGVFARNTTYGIATGWCNNTRSNGINPNGAS